jgi:hypothetical protein
MGRHINESNLANPPADGVVIRISKTAAKVLSVEIRRRKKTAPASVNDLASEAIVAAYDDS